MQATTQPQRSAAVDALGAPSLPSAPSAEADAGIASIGQTAVALYRLLIADLRLSANGLAYALLYAALAVIALAFVALFGSALLVLSLNALGLSWVSALAIATALALATTVAFWLRCRRAVALTGLAASQRQFNQMIAALAAEE